MNTTENVGRECHAVAELFPLLSEAAFDELVADIKKHGLRQPILCDAEGRILDGRNRYRACLAAGVEPRFETWQGEGSAAELVLSLNLKRRHLNESQRALVGARLAMMLGEDATNRRGRPRKNPADLQGFPLGESRLRAAEMVNVSGRLISYALKLLRDGRPELAAEVESGRTTVWRAAGPASPRAPKVPRPAPAAPEPKACIGRYGYLGPHIPGLENFRVPGEDAVRAFWVSADGFGEARDALKARGFRYKPSFDPDV